MKINLVYGNHWNFGIGVGDTFKYLSLALIQSGYKVAISKELELCSLNILLENFDEDYSEKLIELKKQGGKFIVIATEFITSETFNNFNSTLDISYYSDQKYWFKRFKHFISVAEIADGIWHLSDIAANDYEKYLGRPVHYLPHQYVSNFNSVKHRAKEQKDIDFLFTGSMTEYRKQILTALTKRGFSVTASSSLTAPFHRDDLIARSKFCLNIPQFETWPYPSQSRYFYHIINSSVMLSPSVEIKSDLDAYILQSNGNFINFCSEHFYQTDYTAHSTKMKIKFENTTNACIHVSKLVEESIR